MHGVTRRRRIIAGYCREYEEPVGPQNQDWINAAFKEVSVKPYVDD
jgi:hypothetical protein